ncbi:hypothetical protein HQ305_19720 [Rhodococcus sp. BP-149]|uniref:hypothetical protein n=1 Tax=unclassified Rhodococcus (in: high G+C Gram-positive bacteria) TaxID=192944 RepID=UPI001C9AF0F0|nr:MULTISPECIES: hypothetical protein [unclassified Rhodococcus (in: high G+C Gram-positive bacteria)]MBY6687465.1 hypothetical protein [Rhodococcus sp. BP-288]MBY6696440.1 hypothetical protein [Rhodococcus sp. BP-188]MBY6700572.1 hypothetical protein [Rhodococcus sp. BP-285]MBY6704405.1 hypothetical protein [Rhodococcus sp. BP-283]MBY6713697.1 hypothetical protein [Rhodococcus sp. BP-160]
MRSFFPDREQVLTATWTPTRGVEITHADLPDPWLRAIERLSHDLHVRQYGGDIEHIGWVAEYDPDGGAVWLCSAITIVGQRAAGFHGNGMGAYVDADEETALWSMADLVQNAIAEVRTAWPWADAGGFMSAVLDDGIASWRDRNGNTTRIGGLAGTA